MCTDPTMVHRTKGAGSRGKSRYRLHASPRVPRRAPPGLSAVVQRSGTIDILVDNPNCHLMA
jgi:hypothetical protein